MTEEKYTTDLIKKARMRKKCKRNKIRPRERGFPKGGFCVYKLNNINKL